MTDFHPQIARIQKVEKHPNADTLSIYTVLNEYPVVDKTDKYQVGDLVAYLCSDSIVPDTEQFYFLCPSVYEKVIDPTYMEVVQKATGPKYPLGSVPVKCRTIKAKRIRSVYSEGLIVPAPPGLSEGDSIIEHFGLTKREYEEELPERFDAGNEVAPKTFTLSKYDLDGMAKYGYVFEEGEPVLITEKIEGENCTFIYTEDRLWVRSRNWFKRESEDSRWWDLPHRLNMVEKLKNFPDLAIWFELYGSVRGWKYDCEVIDNKIERKGIVFDIWDIKAKRFLEWKDVEVIAQAIEMPTVPILYQGPWKIDRSLHELAEGTSTIGACVREGMVVRSVPEKWHDKLGRKIIKLKGRGYKLFKD